MQHYSRAKVAPEKVKVENAPVLNLACGRISVSLTHSYSKVQLINNPHSPHFAKYPDKYPTVE